MINIENGKSGRIIIKNKRRFILSIIITLIFISFLFYIVSKIIYKRKINNIANVKSISNELPKVENIDSRENEINLNNMYVDSSATDIYKPDGHKIAYVTFDDGPYIKTTPEILKILDKYNIKATFFIVGQMAERYPDIVKMEANDGQSIGNHTYSHNYKYIYSSDNAFIDDINKCDTVLKSIIGSSYNSKLIRFPGGSFGSKREPFRSAIKKAGYHYVDWNDLTGDAEGQNIPVSKLIDNLKKNTIGKEHVVILMHDAPTKDTTVEALPQVIEYLKSQGYAFNVLK